MFRNDQIFEISNISLKMNRLKTHEYNGSHHLFSSCSKPLYECKKVSIYTNPQL